jgi:hypothetical protein
MLFMHGFGPVVFLTSSLQQIQVKNLLLRQLILWHHPVHYAQEKQTVFCQERLATVIQS